MTTHVIYHGHCYDGFTAAWAAYRALGKDAEYIPAKYGDAPPPLPETARVVIADFSYPRAVLEDLRQRVASLTILDHHKTAQADLDGFPGATFDMDHSGACLAWRYFHPKTHDPLFVQYIEDRDLWRFKLPHSREISAYIQSFDYSFLNWDRFHDEISNSIDGFCRGPVTEGSAILRAKEQMVKQMAYNVTFQDWDGLRVPVANAACYFSEVGEQLCIDHPDAKFSAYYFDRRDGKRQWGLRSRGGFDVSAVAKKRGGGGHPGAAGFVENIVKDVS